jgi:hypothetical protein
MLTLKHQTIAQFLRRFRLRFREAERGEAARLAAWLIQRVESGDLTIAQVRAAFDLDTAAKWTTFRDRLVALRDHWVAVEGAKGEG